MGCSPSCPTNFISHDQNLNSNASSSSHFVLLTSTTYGSLVLTDPPSLVQKSQHFVNSGTQLNNVQEFGSSDDPLSPDSVINTWELMADLDDDSEFDFRFSNSLKKSRLCNKSLWEQLSTEKLKLDSHVVSSHEKNESCYLVGAEDRIVLYYTSLRGIRKTYEDCCFVRVIFRGFRVCVDERDISMDRSYRMELQDALKGEALSLPRVFIKGKHIGGVEEIKQLNEQGDLAKLLEGFPLMELCFVCEICGDARFVPCSNCNGSRKVYEEDEFELKRCPDCNENGLIRCSGCCH